MHVCCTVVCRAHVSLMCVLAPCPNPSPHIPYRLPKPVAACAQPGRPNGLQVLLGASGWRLYFQQSTLLPGLALALLYLTVLSLGFLMTSFLAWQGMSEATISLFRAAGALSGLMATVVFPALQRCGVGLVGAAVMGMSWQVRVHTARHSTAGSAAGAPVSHTSSTELFSGYSLLHIMNWIFVQAGCALHCDLLQILH